MWTVKDTQVTMVIPLKYLAYKIVIKFTIIKINLFPWFLFGRIEH